MHTAAIRHISTDAAGRYAVTASYDKTARVWDVASGQLLQVLRPPIGPGNEGKLHGVAISPDGQTVAAGGWTGWDWNGKTQVYIFDRGSGRLLRRLEGLPNVIFHLTFSHDGLFLAATLGQGGILVFGLADNAKPMADADYGSSSYRASWSRDGRLATTSLDGKIRLYRIEGSTLSRLSAVGAPGGRRPFGIAFSPDGAELAVGYADNTRVDILDGASLRIRHTADSTGMASGFEFGVAWSADGSQLMGAGRWPVNGRYPVRRWPQAGRGAPVDTPIFGNSVISMQPLPDGRMLIGAADPAWGVVDPRRNGSAAWQARGTAPIADLRLTPSTRDMFRVSSDGRTVQFAFESADVVGTMHRFDLAQRRLLAGTDPALSKPQWEGLNLKDWEDKLKPTLAGRALELDQNEVSRGLAIAPGAASFVLGADWSLRHFDALGKLLWPQPVAVPGAARSVNIPRAGKVVIAAYEDGTIRWHRLSDGQELLALFAHADRKRWVLWTPSGYYDASVGGEDLIGWHLNRGEDAAADFFPASKFRDRFYRADVIDQVLETLDEAQAVADADAVRGGRATQPSASIVKLLPPVVEVVSPSQVTHSQSQLTIRYTLRSAADAPVTSVFARVNGQALPASRNLVPQAADAVREIRIDVPAQDSQVQLFAENRHGVSTAATVQVKWAGVSPAQAVPATAGVAGFQIQPKLYVLAIGVAAYQHKDIARLSYAAKDARDFAQALQRQQGRLYRTVEVKVVTDDKADKDEIMDALDWLQKQVTQHDVGMLFLSGHGTNDASMGYVYLPVNADPDRLKRTAVTMADIRTTLNSVAGKVVAFLDTCHSGNVFGTGQKTLTDLAGVINELASAENGVVVFSSSTGRQFSLEKPEWGNGAFTKALIEGIDGKADTLRSGRVTYKMLDLYVTERVKVLTQGRQSPVTQAPGGVNDFPLALLK